VRCRVFDPRLLILDEATEGLAPLIRQEIYRSIERLRPRLSILVIDKDVRALTKVADRHYVLERAAWCGAEAPPSSGQPGTAAPLSGRLTEGRILFFMGNLATPEALLARWRKRCATQLA